MSPSEFCFALREKTSLPSKYTMKENIFRNYLIVIPNKEHIQSVKEHLRYWPYVKAFSEDVPHFINVRICIGEVKSSTEKDYYITRTLELIRLCLRQYGALVCPNTASGKFIYRRYSNTLFLRPDDQLKEFRPFIEEIKSLKTSTK